MKKFCLTILILVPLMLLAIGIISASTSFTNQHSESPYFCYMNSPYHCNSYKAFSSGEDCTDYCNDQVYQQSHLGNREDFVYNCMVQCLRGDDAGNTLFMKRYNGQTGLGLNYKF